MKSTYECPVCRYAMVLHGNQVPWEIRAHIKAMHPEVMLTIRNEENKISESIQALKAKYPHAVKI